MHSVIESWKGHIDYRSNFHIDMLINRADGELRKTMHNYIAFSDLNEDDDDIIMTYVENHFSHKIYNRVLP